MSENKRTFSTAEILVVAKATYYRLEYLVRTGKVNPINRVPGQERRFSEEEALRAVDLLRGKKSNVAELQELADG